MTTESQPMLIGAIIFCITAFIFFIPLIYTIFTKNFDMVFILSLMLIVFFGFISFAFYSQHLYNIKMHTKKILLIKKVSKILSIPANKKQKNDKIYLLSLASKKSYKYDNIIFKCSIKYGYNKDTVDFKAIKSCVEGKLF